MTSIVDNNCLNTQCAAGNAQNPLNPPNHEPSNDSSIVINNHKETSVEAFYSRHTLRNFASFWFIGNINNFHYCLVLSASNNIATSYHMKSLTALITWANVVGGIAVRIWNAFFCEEMSYIKRMLITVGQTLFGLLLVCIAAGLQEKDNNRTSPNSRDILLFSAILIGVLFVGNGSSFGESVVLGYMERFPSRYVTGWSSGTGISGVAATIMYLIFQTSKVSDSVTFGVSAVFVIPYLAFFFWGILSPVVNVKDIVHIDKEVDEESSSNYLETSKEYYEEEVVVTGTTNWKLLSWSSDLHLTEKKEIKILVESGRQIGIRKRLANWWNSPEVREWCFLHNVSLWNNINLALVYIFEYAVQFMAAYCFVCYDHNSKASNITNFFLDNAFVITQFCYQTGVLVSRTSTLCFRIKRIWIPTILQFINIAIWWTQAKLKYIAPKDMKGVEKSNNASDLLPYYIILFVMMFYVGLLGGASYVNVFYNILDLSKTEKFNDGADAAKARGIVPAGEVEMENRLDNNNNKNATIAKSSEEHINKRELEGTHHDHEKAALATELSYSEREVVSGKRRQMCMNIGALYATLGITIGCIADVIFAKLLSKKDGCE